MKTAEPWWPRLPDDLRHCFSGPGIPIHSDPNCVSTKEFRDVRRTWRERLFSRPWRPWRATRSEGIPMAYIMEVPTTFSSLLGMLSPLAKVETRKEIVAHPEIVAQLRERFGR